MALSRALASISKTARLPSKRTGRKRKAIEILGSATNTFEVPFQWNKTAGKKEIPLERLHDSNCQKILNHLGESDFWIFSLTVNCSCQCEAYWYVFFFRYSNSHHYYLSVSVWNKIIALRDWNFQRRSSVNLLRRMRLGSYHNATSEWN